MRLSIGGADAARWSASGIAFPVGAVSSDAQLTLGGALAAGDPGADVTIYAKNVRTAGYLLAIQNLQGSNRLLVDYNGLLRLQIPAAAIQPASLVTAITANTGWTAGSGDAAPGYWKDASGTVHMKGTATLAGGGTTVAITLPAGFRPKATRTRILATTSNNTKFQPCAIQADGGINLSAAVAGDIVALDGISFLAEQ